MNLSSVLRFWQSKLKKEFIIILIILILNLCHLEVYAKDILSQSISSSENLPCIMSFHDTVKYSLENNNNIKALRNHLLAIAEDVGIAKSDLLPHAKFLESFMVSNNPIEAFAMKLNQTNLTMKDLSFGTLDYPGAIRNFLTSLSIEQTFFDKKSFVSFQMTKKEYSASEYLYIRKKEELINQVTQACIKINKHKDTIKVIKECIEDSKEHLKIAQERYEKKNGLYSDIIRAQSAVEEVEEKMNMENTRLEIAKKSLGLLLGIENSVEISDSIPEIKFSNDLCCYQSIALFRSDVKAMEIRVENTKNNIKHEQADWYPTLNAIASYNFYSPYYPFGGLGNNYIAAAYFRWNIFDGNKRIHGVRKAKYLTEEAKEQLEGFKKEVNFKVYEIYTRVDSDIKKLEDAKIAQITAEESQILIRKNWNNAQLPFVAVIDSQYNLNNARLDVVNKQFELQEDLITLIYETGVIYQALKLD